MKKRSQKKSPGSVLVKMAADRMLNMYIAGALLPEILLESQAATENPDL
jgi:hypothetical protein